VKGYGVFRHEGKMKKAHRMSWLFHFGPIPEEMDVLHSCDQPLCCNPWHLFLGDNAANTADRHAKGRDAVGEANSASKLFPSQVREMILAYESGLVSQEALALFYGVTQSTVGAVVRYETWKHVSGGGR
jgi:hypothetical protein